MQLTIHAKGEGANVLSFLLAKHPERLYEREYKGHKVRLFYQCFTPNEVKLTIYAVLDAISLVRDGGEKLDITHYINDREFAVSSLFLSLIRSPLATALNGLPKEEYLPYVEQVFQFSFSFGPVNTDLSVKNLRELFSPLGFTVSVQSKTKNSPLYVTVTGETTLQRGLRQLFILIPVIDNYKHYYIDEKEAEKLQRFGEGWLEDHPQKEWIYKRALKYKGLLNGTIFQQGKVEREKKQKGLNQRRYEKIIEIIQAKPHLRKIVDMGSGEGKLSTRLGFLPHVSEIIAVEPSERETLKATKRYAKAAENAGFLMPIQKWGSVFYYDDGLKNKDVFILCEVIEHIAEEKLQTVMQLIFQEYKPEVCIITTPNKEYNTLYQLGETMRHYDHRFEWTRAELHAWVEKMTAMYAYKATISSIGEIDHERGGPTQIVVFEKGVMI
ncbi:MULTISPECIES: 3' terminal RNA ribose 2'-O-methyltransferase Hen1 [Cytobacillus]|uniref:Small RNA 2'-O-methyltransferase n=1 Tax=Cytobacillus stercorigallinarum TaxID=2762240 RepID=A0ABR8QLU2_9BACI|nr:3' terminal RNA ribose 2'-O-methyltransferase Hen1 [Cytobacillus stercorigallinarum]MBD7936469.1 3' terminal RNA ribose 2'-O-methyltransferase Hen1 [Cytobacillus stercorigallinarum]